MKGFLPLMFSVLLLAAACAPQPRQPEPAAQLPNPVVEVEDASALAELGFAIDAPEGAEDVHYSIISDEIAQVQFALDGREYVYRGADQSLGDVAGVYESFDEESLGVEADGENWYASVTVQTIRKGEDGALARFIYGERQYTLFTPDSVTGEELGQLAVRLAQKVCPMPE